MITGLLSLLSYALLAGAVEGILYGMKGSASFKWNEHIVFFLKMCSVGVLYLLPPVTLVVDRCVVLACWILFYSLVHDGAYYETRRLIDQPQYRWYYDYSKTSTARLEIRFLWRVLMGSAGTVLIVAYQFVK
jgi:hypothetical protein